MKISRLLVFLGIIALLAGVVACASGGKVQPIGSASGSATGTAMGFGGNVTVTITMEGGFITDVDIDARFETQAIAGTVISRAPTLIKENNSAQFDAVSGATITSTAIREAAQAAIDQIVDGN